MNESIPFDKITEYSTEFIAGGSRIYTFKFEDGTEKHFILPADKVIELLENSDEDPKKMLILMEKYLIPI